jgi:UDP-3-O-[3-hydroxymyristoyl] glucosamine N-acyltransferase
MGHTIRDIAAALGAQAEGDLDLLINRAAEPAMAGPDALALAMDPKYADGLSQGGARAAILWPGADWRALGLERPPSGCRARAWRMAGLSRLLDSGPVIAPGVHPLAAIDPTALLGEGARVGPFVTIGPGTVIGRARGSQAMCPSVKTCGWGMTR